MKLEDRVQSAIKNSESDVILRSDVAGLGSASRISAVLKILCERGIVVRIGQGVYARATLDSITGDVVPVQSLEFLARDAFQRLKPGRSGRILGKLSFGGMSVFRGPYPGSALRFQPNGISGSKNRELDIPDTGLKDYICGLARRLKVVYVKTVSDEWAESVSRLADDDIRTDDVEQVVLALNKARKITDMEMVTMLTNYLREKEHVRSIQGF